MRAARLVVVDDDIPLAQELAQLLAEVGYEVAGIAGEAQAAIELVGKAKPDLVVMDVRMPGMSGTQAAAVLSAEHPELPVVLWSAYDDDSIVKAARQAAVAAYVVKGCGADELLSAVGTLVGRPGEDGAGP